MVWKIRRADGTMVELGDGEFLYKEIFKGGQYVGNVTLGTWIQFEQGEISEEELLAMLFTCERIERLNADDGYEIWAE